jgi:hypothetical protein
MCCRLLRRLGRVCTPCPAGTYGATAGQTAATCSRRPRGYYGARPQGRRPLLDGRVPAGTYGTVVHHRRLLGELPPAYSTGGATSAACTPCPRAPTGPPSACRRARARGSALRALISTGGLGQHVCARRPAPGTYRRVRRADLPCLHRHALPGAPDSVAGSTSSTRTPCPAGTRLAPGRGSIRAWRLWVLRAGLPTPRAWPRSAACTRLPRGLRRQHVRADVRVLLWACAPRVPTRRAVATSRGLHAWPGTYGATPGLTTPTCSGSARRARTRPAAPPRLRARPAPGHVRHGQWAGDAVVLSLLRRGLVLDRRRHDGGLHALAPAAPTAPRPG